MTFFELLVEFLQAFIFTLLAALYIGDAVSRAPLTPGPSG